MYVSQLILLQKLFWQHNVGKGDFTMMDSNTIGTRIKALREKMGKTQADVAEALHVKRQTVDQWENGTRDLKTQYTISLADYFGVSCDEILRGIKAENLSINKKLGLSDKSIEILESDFASDDRFTVVLNTLIENLHMREICQQVLWMIWTDITYGNEEERISYYNEIVKEYGKTASKIIDDETRMKQEMLLFLVGSARSNDSEYRDYREFQFVHILKKIVEQTYDSLVEVFSSKNMIKGKPNHGKS